MLNETAILNGLISIPGVQIKKILGGCPFGVPLESRLRVANLRHVGIEGTYRGRTFRVHSAISEDLAEDWIATTTYLANAWREAIEALISRPPAPTETDHK